MRELPCACYHLESDDDIFWIFIEPFFSDHFFSGFVQYVGMKNDTAAGVRFIKEKVKRMIEKMADMEHAYTFDVFEELLFSIALLFAREDVAFRKALGAVERKIRILAGNRQQRSPTN